ncbi:MAG: apolipoprotein N-acyltransferase [Spirochaetaceae bacterium]|jgi:apolipoprotein N-acyltransferase|nr:apolipoprotein N-acyltransferase [Spirochaetaceae bacterium]
MKRSKNLKLSSFLYSLLLILLSALLFTLAHPNILFKNGIQILGWVMYIPVLVLLKRSPLLAAVLWGGMYGCISFAMFTYWVSAFHILSGIIISLIYLVYFAALFFTLKVAQIIFPRRGWIVQCLLWTGFEFLRTKGFLGFGYGITAYTQWQNIKLIQIASIFGIWGINALMIWPQTLLASAFDRQNDLKIAQNWKISAVFVLNKIKIPLLFWFFALSACIIYGFASKTDYSQLPQVRAVLIQSNADPWKNVNGNYRGTFNVLTRLSNEALAAGPRPDIVVWPETAFIPMIYWNDHYRTNPVIYPQVKELLEYLRDQDVPFVIGNDDGRAEMDESGNTTRVDYNAAILFENGEMKDIYRKIHLVPFSEYFPYRNQLPFIYDLLVKTGAHFWEPGKKPVVFSIKRKSSEASEDLKFSTPICFEDTFGDGTRIFALGGADFFVNLSNDSWSHSLPCQMQHLSMAVFRSVETGRSMVRSTASGQTCAINPNGEIVAMAAAFEETSLNVSVPVEKKISFYTKHGDFLPVFCLILAALVLLIGLIVHIIKNYDKQEKNPNS